MIVSKNNKKNPTEMPVVVVVVVVKNVHGFLNKHFHTFWAAAPKGLMTYAFTYAKIFPPSSPSFPPHFVA